MNSDITSGQDDAPVPSELPNILYVHIDNLGMGELGCYSGGILRGADTARLDRFAGEGLQLLNFAPEAQCTPSRSALMTGRHPIRSGLARVQWPGVPGGLVAWEQTMGDILSAAGYATAVYGKWHIGDEPGRYREFLRESGAQGPPSAVAESLGVRRSRQQRFAEAAFSVCQTR